MPTHTLTIDGWRPTSLNRLLGHWAKRGRAKRRDREWVTLYALAQGIPKATTARRVSVRVECRGCSPDPDNLLKSLLDALTHAEMIVDDSGEWCVLGTVEVVRAGRDRTVVTLEEV